MAHALRSTCSHTAEEESSSHEATPPPHAQSDQAAPTIQPAPMVQP